MERTGRCRQQPQPLKHNRSLNQLGQRDDINTCATRNGLQEQHITRSRSHGFMNGLAIRSNTLRRQHTISTTTHWTNVVKPGDAMRHECLYRRGLYLHLELPLVHTSQTALQYYRSCVTSLPTRAAIRPIFSLCYMGFTL